MIFGMEFHEFSSTFDLVQRHGLSSKMVMQDAEKEVGQSYADRAQKIDNLNRFKAEAAWAKNSRPYYKIWPEAIPMLTDVGIDVPVSYLQVPFSAFVLRLPKSDNPLIVDEQHSVSSILVLEGIDEEASRNRVIMLWMDIGEKDAKGFPLLSFVRLTCLPSRTIEETLGTRMLPGLPGLQIADELKIRCLKLAVSVCFLSTGVDRLIEPDVLSKDLAAYIEARKACNEEKSKVIEDRAISRGKHGWNVGQYERLRTLVSRSGNETDNEIVSRGPLTHQHQRRAHFRLLASNKVVFIRQATVRPDLPPPDHAPGYGLR
jgi:hypothetical protein